jgi:TonB family protein
VLDPTASSCPRCGAELSSNDSSAGQCPACLLLTALPHPGDERHAVSTLAPGTEVGPFRVVRLLGRGGMASVYEAVEDQLERSVALKILPPEFLHEQTFARRFEQEARVVARLEHQHIVPIFATGIEDGIPWMSTRLMAGGNLATRLARGPIEPAEGLRVLRHVAEALDHAHARGVVHRDVKPANILLDAEGEVYLADFGLALMLEGGTRLSHGVLTGTPQYMSPEQALGQSADHRSDIYSLAIVAYEVFTGTVPFQAESPIGVLMKHVNDPLPVPAGDPLPPRVFRSLCQATAKTPDARFASAGTFIADLERAFSSQLSPGSKHAVYAFARELEERTAKWLAVAGGVFATAALVVVLALEMRPAPEPHAEPIAPGKQPSADDLSETPQEGTPQIDPQKTSRGRAAAPAVNPVDKKPSDAESPDRDVVVDRITTTSGPSVQEPLPSETDDETKGLPTAVVQPVVEKRPPQPDTIVKAVLRPPTVTPAYPAILKEAGIAGRVIIDATIGVDGSVTAVRIVQSDDRRLDEHARAAVLKYRYTPQSRNGTPEESIVPVTVHFSLK